MLLFISHLYTRGCTSSTMRVYTSAVRSLHVEEGHGNPLENYLRVKQSLRACDNITRKPVKKLPITLDILTDMYTLMGNSTHDRMLWAAFTLAFYGGLRAAELTVNTNFHQDINMCQEDVKFISHKNIPIMTIYIKTSKTDVKGVGFHIVIACVDHVTCAYCAMDRYLKFNSSNPKDPLFKYEGVLLNRSLYQKALKLYVSALGYPAESYSGHSLRAGCATSAAAAGMMDWEIKLLGRWKSDAYQGYIRAPTEMLAKLSRRMVGQHTDTP